MILYTLKIIDLYKHYGVLCGTHYYVVVRISVCLNVKSAEFRWCILLDNTLICIVIGEHITLLYGVQFQFFFVKKKIQKFHYKQYIVNATL